MRLIASLIVLILVAGLGCAGPDVIVTVRGLVEDSVNQVGIPGAIVAAGTYSAVTDAAGEYNLVMRAGSATFRVTAEGYNTQGQRIIIGPEKTCFLSFGLTDYFYKAGHQTGVVQGTVADLKNVDPYREQSWCSRALVRPIR